MAVKPPFRRYSLEFVEAAFDGDMDKVKTLHQMGVDIDFMDWADVTALNAAGTSGRMDIVKYLLERGADMSGSLIGPACYRHFDIVESIIREAKRRKCVGRMGVKKALWHTTDAKERPLAMARHIKSLLRTPESEHKKALARRKTKTRVKA